MPTSLLSAAGVGGDNHGLRWFEAGASRRGAQYFDKRYGSGAPGYFAGSPDHFDINIFDTGGNTLYINPRTGAFSQGDYPISGVRFHWFDIIVPLFAASTGLRLSLLF